MATRRPPGSSPRGTPALVLVRRIVFPGSVLALDDVAEDPRQNRGVAHSLVDGDDVVLVVSRAQAFARMEDLYPIGLLARVTGAGAQRALQVSARVRVHEVLHPSSALRVTHAPWEDTDVDAGVKLWTELRDTLTFIQVVQRHVPAEQVRAILKELEARQSHEIVARTLDRALSLPYLTLSFEDRVALLCQTSLKRRIELAAQLLRRTLDQRLAADAAAARPPPEPRPAPVAAPAAPAPAPRPPPAPAAPPKTAYERPVKSLPVQVQLAIAEATERGAVNFTDFLRMVPWGWLSPSDFDTAALGARLDRIVGLADARQLVLDAAAALRGAGASRPKPLCLIGPASVDKALVAQAMADAFGRPLARVSLKGASALELRGRARTPQDDVTPGRFAVALAEAGAANPVMLLEHVDDVDGADACAALLEALDAARNKTFADAYVAIGLDLSRVLFVLTADDPRRIPQELAAVIQPVVLRGYTLQEKATLLRERLLPSALSAVGVSPSLVTLTRDAVDRLCARYATGAGVAGLDDVLERLARSIAMDLSLGASAVQVGAPDLTKRVGAPTDGAPDDDATAWQRTPSTQRVDGDLTQPSSLGGYRLIERIGEGGMAEVFIGERTDRAERVAIKRMRPDIAREPGFREMFHDEARLAARLHHPHIVEIIEVGEDRGTPFLAMQLCRGVSLARVRRTMKTLEPDLAVVIGIQVLTALHYAHELRDDAGAPLGVVHRDISPHNLMLDLTGDVRLLDFGIARAAGRTTRTATGMVKGKVAYMAPEQLDGAEDRRADLFAVGVVLCELLCGERHVSGDDVVIMKKLMRREYTLPASLASAPDVLRSVIDRALAPDPAVRFPTAREMASALAWAMPTNVSEARLRLAELVRFVGEPAVITGTLTIMTDPDPTEG